MIYIFLVLYFLIPPSCQSLFENSYVIELSQHNYNKYNDRPKFLLFYLSSCSHCQKFAPFWKDLAVETRRWNYTVLIGAIDCQPGQNDEICINSGVTKFPHIEVLRPFSDIRLTDAVSPIHDVRYLKNILLQKLLQISLNWPQLHFSSSIDNLTSKDNIVIIEKEGNTLGVQVILDLYGTIPNAKSQLSIIRITPQTFIAYKDKLSKLSGIDPLRLQALVDETTYDKTYTFPSTDRQSQLQYLERILRSTSEFAQAFGTKADNEQRALLLKLTVPNSIKPQYKIISSNDYGADDVIESFNLLGPNNDKQSDINGALNALKVTTNPPYTMSTNMLPPNISVAEKNTKFKGHYNCVFTEDLEYAIYCMLAQEVPRTQTFNVSTLHALSRMVQAMALFYPRYATRLGDSASIGEINTFLNALHERLTPHYVRVSATSVGYSGPQYALVTPPSVLTNKQYLGILESLNMSSVFPKDRLKWVGCKGSKPTLRGYTCGLWTLFHTLTVYANKYSGENAYHNGLTLLSIIREYIKYFFGCQDCTQHFLAMSANITTNVPLLSQHLVNLAASNDQGIFKDEMAFATSDSFVRNSLDFSGPHGGNNLTKSPNAGMMWLWAAHNRVNRRLAQDKGPSSNDPLAPKILFPPTTLCPTCRIISAENQQGWSINSLQNFMLDYYKQATDNPYTEKDLISGACVKIPMQP